MLNSADTRYGIKESGKCEKAVSMKMQGDL